MNLKSRRHFEKWFFYIDIVLSTDLIVLGEFELLNDLVDFLLSDDNFFF